MLFTIYLQAAKHCNNKACASYRIQGALVFVQMYL